MLSLNGVYGTALSEFANCFSSGGKLLLTSSTSWVDSISTASVRFSTYAIAASRSAARAALTIRIAASTPLCSATPAPVAIK